MTEPALTIIAGPNGSGKSTLTDLGQLSAHGLRLPGQYINPDEIAKGIVDTDIARRDSAGIQLDSPPG